MHEQQALRQKALKVRVRIPCPRGRRADDGAAEEVQRVGERPGVQHRPGVHLRVTNSVCRLQFHLASAVSTRLFGQELT